MSEEVSLPAMRYVSAGIGKNKLDVEFKVATTDPKQIAGTLLETVGLLASQLDEVYGSSILRALIAETDRFAHWLQHGVAVGDLAQWEQDGTTDA